MRKQRKSKIKRGTSFFYKIFISVIFILLITGGIYAYWKYKKVYQPNVVLEKKHTEYLYIPTGSTVEDVIQLLYENNYIINRSSFEWLAEKKKYKNHVHPGRYLLKDNMSNNELINLLRSGEQVPVNIIYSRTRTKEQLASKISKQIEADSLSIVKLLNDENFVSNNDFNLNTIISMFIPNTYEFYWNTSAEQFFKRMNKEYKIFWNKKRRNKADKIGLTQIQVSILASIVEEETKKNDEKPIVAGVYMNRLKKGMRLQADPSIIFAIGDFSIRRVLKKHLSYDSPYNTYKYSGLPPGPISLPSISSIDGVLNFEKHDYLFFCAKGDFSGYHYFAKTLAQHNLNARKYQNTLNKRRIMK